jgi:hypothetical protein
MYAHCGCALLWSIQSLWIFALTHLPPTCCFLTAFSTHPYILYLHILRYALSFSFPLSFPEFHRAVPLLPTCSTTEFVYGHAWFCVHVYLRIYLPCMRENMLLLFFWPRLTSLSITSSNCIPWNPIYYFLWLSNTPLCIYTTISWSIHQL